MSLDDKPRVVTAAEMRGAGFAGDSVPELQTYAVIVVHDPDRSLPKTDFPISIGEFEIQHHPRTGKTYVDTPKASGSNADEDHLLAITHEQASRALGEIAAAQWTVAFMKLTYVHSQPPTFQGHGLGVPHYWIATLAQHQGWVDIDQYIVGVD